MSNLEVEYGRLASILIHRSIIVDTFERRRQAPEPVVRPAAERPARYSQGAAGRRHRKEKKSSVPGLSPSEIDRLAAAARNQDRKALKTLFGAYKDRLYRIALMLLSSHASAEAVTEEVFVRFASDPPRAASPFERWVFGETVRICVTQMEEDPVCGASERLSIDEPQRGAAIRRLIAGQLAQLPPSARVAFVLGEGAGFSYDEVAGIMDVPRSDVPVLLAEARGALASVLEKIEFEGWNAG